MYKKLREWLEHVKLWMHFINVEDFRNRTEQNRTEQNGTERNGTEQNRIERSDDIILRFRNNSLFKTEYAVIT